MEDVKNENDGKKRARDDSDFDSPEEERVEIKKAKGDSEFDSDEFDRFDSAESEPNSPELSRIPDDILDILDEPDSVVTDSDPAIQDLDSVIKSFEEEILHHSLPPPDEIPAALSDSGESQPDLGYLLEASDDELGLPPTVSPSETKIESIDLGNMNPEAEALGFDNEFPSYDSFGFGIGEETEFSNGEFVTVGGLFDYDSAEFSEFLYAR
ncbi:hypothetical protein LOK49_Contig313G00002 [Camellia lanceoleosa]|nr:hypothetical protein LOK49_Contig313G00002 [Camellia lanceoleosa]